VTSDLGYTLGGPLKMGPAINGGNSKMWCDGELMVNP
jgi:hypothetical protein